ncbi:MAG: hypothetical protein KatS3mg061_2573 [Dehalococcoidia bacterium]|nr:MAG: hypothetical protein KatS3mg061_2573 [Dehalococcoidia bacterium]
MLTGRYAPYGVRYPPQVAPVVVYGTSWCAASQLIRRYLERLGIPYRYVDLERDPTRRRPASLADRRLR